MLSFKGCTLIFLLSISVLAHAQIKLIENKGQYPEQFEFVGNIPGGRVFFSKSGLMYEFTDFDYHKHHTNDAIEQSLDESGSNMVNGHAYNWSFINANPYTTVTGYQPEPTLHSYFFGDKSNWVSGAREFNEIVFQDIYAEIDYRYAKTEGTIRYDFIVHPNGTPEDIRIALGGLSESFIDGSGNLNLITSVSKVVETKPYTYQIIDGQKVEVRSLFHLENNILSFDLIDKYDPCYDLIIDPTLIFSTYSGSTADNWGNTATFDSNSNLYSGGITNHYSGGNFPASSGAYQISSAGFWDVAIIKYDSLGQNALYATYLGGEHSEVPQSMVVNGNNELLIMGVTSSTSFPTNNAFSSTFNGGEKSLAFGSEGDNLFFENGTDIFISKLSADGQNLLSSTFIGGSDNDGLMSVGDPLTANYGDQSRGDIFIRSNGNVLVASKTLSSDFPVLNALQPFNASDTTDAVLFELSPDLNTLNFSSYFGGTDMDAAYTVKESSTGKIIFGGGTQSSNIANNHTNFSSTSFGNIDGWLAIIDGTTYALDTGFYIGTGQYDQLYFVDLDIDDNIYTYGQSAGSFPVVGGVFTSGGGQFIQKWNSDLTTLIASTKFGAPGDAPDISPTAFLVNDCDNIYISGWGGGTNGTPYIGGGTTNMPITNDAFQSVTSGSDFYLMTISSDLSSLLYATYLGGNQSNTHVDGGTSRFDKRGFVYHAVCAGCGGVSDFPTTEGAWSNTNNSPNCNNAAFKFDLATLRARIRTNSITLDKPGIENICFPDEIAFQNLSIGGVDYEWDLGDGTFINTSDTATFFHQYKRAGFYRVTLKAIDPTTCIGEDITSVNVRVNTPAFTVIDNQAICEGSSIELNANGGVNYFWISRDATFQSEEKSPEVSPEATTVYNVTITDDLGCNATDTVRVEVVPSVDVDFDYQKETDCFSRSVLGLKNTSEMNEGDVYQWSLGDGNTSDLEEFLYNYQEDGTYEVKLIGRKEFCVYEKSELIDISTIKVPNVFTPNDDGDNDVFEIVSGTQVDLKVYNRWGRLVYENEDYQDTWDGATEPAGLYYFEAIITDETTCKGWVHLLK
ncbi:DUF7948 domain-containing protein [Fulvivirga lutea]|uniref:Gliding motility-associated C-terminal domain-containing protein n=1 Tax=Fulvivirga lutea TaxID=2810512 RepID=A0A974WFG2_9BACT|nr:PKD domain-containing protein [Fulvivirga lutea]QSE96127.1 gliding motility-associated C-terminal domain-containing protein [Fulvivirga lutea]